jgi:hypothetical protein
MPERSTRTKRSGWKQWTAVEAQHELKAWRRSGLPLGTYARQRGVGAERLRWWRKRLGEVAQAPVAAPAQEPVRLVPAFITSSASPLTGATVTVRLPGGVALEVADVAAVPAEWLGTLVRAVTGAGR